MPRAPTLLSRALPATLCLSYPVVSKSLARITPSDRRRLVHIAAFYFEVWMEYSSLWFWFSVYCCCGSLLQLPSFPPCFLHQLLLDHPLQPPNLPSLGFSSGASKATASYIISFVFSCQMYSSGLVCLPAGASSNLLLLTFTITCT